MRKLLISILIDEYGGTLSITRKTSNTLITASGFNTNYDQIEAVVNGSIEAANLASDAVTGPKIAGSAFRTGYGVKQHTDDTIMAELASSNPGLEVAGSGLTVKVTGIATLQSGGIDGARQNDVIFSSNTTTPTGWSDISSTYNGKMVRIGTTALSTGGSDTLSGNTGDTTLTTAQIPSGLTATIGKGDRTSPGSMTGFGSDSAYGTTTLSINGGGQAHSHPLTSVSCLNAYVSLKCYQKS